MKETWRHLPDAARAASRLVPSAHDEAQGILSNSVCGAGSFSHSETGAYGVNRADTEQAQQELDEQCAYSGGFFVDPHREKEKMFTGGPPMSSATAASRTGI
jgi:hypothetical protein